MPDITRKKHLFPTKSRKGVQFKQQCKLIHSQQAPALDRGHIIALSNRKLAPKTNFPTSRIKNTISSFFKKRGVSY